MKNLNIPFLSDNREVLIYSMDWAFFENVGKVAPNERFLMAQNGYCGCSKTWNRDDIPKGSYKCEHGNYLIMYRESPLVLLH